MPRPNNVGVGTALLIFNRDRKVLLGKRKGAHRAGCWAPPGGWLDRPDVSTEEAVIRETFEETGLVVRFAERFFWTTEDQPELGARTVTLYHLARPHDWSGTPEVREPNKCDEWRWFALDDLPGPMFPGVGEALDEYRERGN